MCVCVCVSVYICVCIAFDIDIVCAHHPLITHNYVYICMWLLMCEHIHIHQYTCVQVCIYVCVIHKYICVCVYLYVCVHRFGLQRCVSTPSFLQTRVCLLLFVCMPGSIACNRLCTAAHIRILFTYRCIYKRTVELCTVVHTHIDTWYAYIHVCI